MVSTILYGSGFFGPDEEPMICFETTGLAHSRKGVMIDFKSIYARRHNLYDVVAEIRACIA